MTDLKNYPTKKVILGFGSIGFIIGSILGLLTFISEKKAIYDWEHYGKLMQRDTIPYKFAFLAPFIIIGVYPMVVGGILAFQRIVWRKRFFDKMVYFHLLLAMMFASMVFAIFLVIIDISPFFAVIFLPLQTIFTLVATFLFLPKGEK